MSSVWVFFSFFLFLDLNWIIICLLQVNCMWMTKAHLSTCSLTLARPKLPVYSLWIWPWIPQSTNLMALTIGNITLNHHLLLHITYRCICHSYIKLGSQKRTLWPRVTFHKACENKITGQHAPKQGISCHYSLPTEHFLQDDLFYNRSYRKLRPWQRWICGPGW